MKEKSRAKQEINIRGDIIEIKRLDSGVVAYTSYVEGIDDFVDEIKNSLWTLTSAEGSQKQYMKRSKKNKTERLHKFIFNYFLGEDYVKEMYEKGFIIEHIDDDGLNNRFENLAFMSRTGNRNKDINYDTMKENYKYDLVIDVRSGFRSGYFQINLLFNKQVPVVIEGEELENIYELNLLYDENLPYDDIIHEAERIMKSHSEDGRVEFNKDEHKIVDYNYSFMPVYHGNGLCMLSTRPVMEWL